MAEVVLCTLTIPPVLISLCIVSPTVNPPEMSLSAISHYVFTDSSAEGRMLTISWLMARNLLANTISCHKCASDMTMVKRDQQGTSQDDKCAWRCPSCYSIRSIRSGSWFEGTTLLY